MFKILLTLLFSFYTTLSYSHSQLTNILPKNNIVYTKTPSKIELTFRSKVKLIKIDPVSYTHLTLPTTPYV